MKKKVKGFTLVEMIIVLALFSIIMYSVVQLLNPVTRFFVRSSNYETSTACVDNMKRCIEGNLKYADRVRAYSGDLPYAVDQGNCYGESYPADTPKRALITNKLKSDLDDFFAEFFANRVCIDTSGKIYVLCFDNTVYAPILSNFDQLSDYAGKYNSGQITLYQFDFDSYQGVYGCARDDGTIDPLQPSAITGYWIVPAACGGNDTWAVNQKLYGSFDYHFRLSKSGDFLTTTASSGSETTTTTTTTTTSSVTTDTTTSVSSTDVAPVVFNPADFAIEITMKEVKRDEGDLIRTDVASSTMSAFAMKNVLDSTKMFSVSLLDYVTGLKPGRSETDGMSDCYQLLRKVSRYEKISRNETSGYDGFYFIFTLAESTHTNSSLHTTEVGGSQVWIENIS